MSREVLNFTKRQTLLVDFLFVAFADTGIDRTEFPGAGVRFDGADVFHKLNIALAYRTGSGILLLLGLVHEGLFLSHSRKSPLF